MIKKHFLLIVTTLAVLMYSCGKKDNNDAKNPDPEPTKELVIGIEGGSIPQGAVILLGKNLTISDITENSAKGAAFIAAVDPKDPITAHGFNVTAVGTSNPTAFRGGAISGTGEIKIDFTGLKEETEYEVKFFVTTAKGTAFHPETVKFKTIKKDTPPPPVVYHDQRVLIEEFTGAWCGWCPRGLWTLETLTKQNPGYVFGAAIHYGDPMEHQILYNTLNSLYKVPGFPSGMVNRVSNGGIVQNDENWGKAARALLSKNSSDRSKPELGVAIETTLDGNNLKGKVMVNFREKKARTVYKLVMYVLEDGITGYPQRNYLAGRSEYSNIPYYSQPDPINDFVHNHVVRRLLTDSRGDVIPDNLISNGATYTFDFETDLARYKAENCSIVAFVIDGSAKPIIINVNEVKAGKSVNY
jgi:hypothetical protein